MTAKRFYMDKSGDLYDKENGLLMLDFGYSYDGVNCKRIIDLLNAFNDENIVLKKKLEFLNELNKPYGELIGEIQRLKEENEHLKKRVEKLEL